MTALPELDAENHDFWTAGRDGCLRFLRCDRCAYFVHPPLPRCPACGIGSLSYSKVSGNGVIFARTINYQRWSPDLEVPYCLAIVSIPEQTNLRLTTRIVGCPPESVAVGMAVEVTFADRDPIFLPYFRPRGERSDGSVT